MNPDRVLALVILTASAAVTIAAIWWAIGVST